MHEIPAANVRCLATLTSRAQNEKWPLSKDITIVYITDETIEALGSFPFNRKVYADFITTIYEKYDPSVVYLDVFIVDSNKDLPESDVILAGSVEGKDDLIFGAIPGKREIEDTTMLSLAKSLWPSDVKKSLKSSGVLLPLKPILDKGGTAAMAYAQVNSQGYFDSFTTIINVGGLPIPSTPMAMVRDYADLPEAEQGPFVEAIETDKNGNFKIDLDHRFTTVDLLAVLNGTAEPAHINGRIVMLGANFSGGADIKSIGRNYLITGTELTALATQTLLNTFRTKQAQ